MVNASENKESDGSSADQAGGKFEKRGERY